MLTVANNVMVLAMFVSLRTFVALPMICAIEDDLLVRSKKKLAALETDLQAKTVVLDERWNELSHISQLLVSPAPLRSGMNLTKRSQALHMFRRGESPKAIATTLSLPQREVDLLVKVQRMAAG